MQPKAFQWLGDSKVIASSAWAAPDSVGRDHATQRADVDEPIPPLTMSRAYRMEPGFGTKTFDRTDFARDLHEKRRPIRSGVVRQSARERIRTSTPFPELPPQGSASANSATRAGGGLRGPTGVSRVGENTRIL